CTFDVQLRTRSRRLSSLHHTATTRIYTFPYTTLFRSAVKESKRIAVPGCHASGFIALVAPLVAAGLLSPAAYLTCHSITGYSGGDRKSTRLNSSHVSISYAVFCLKKKRKHTTLPHVQQ